MLYYIKPYLGSASFARRKISRAKLIFCNI